MNSFLQRHADSVTGMVSGFDRVRFQGTLRRLANARGMNAFLLYLGVAQVEDRRPLGPLVKKVCQVVR